MKVLALILALATLAAASKGSGREQLQEDYGYVEVRPGAHMFYVMYHVDQPGDNADYPLIMWLQGGPGASGVGYGNFEELGPYDINGNPREYAWTKKANVMFVDNPVGTGYSYVDDYSALTTDNAQIALDLVEVVKAAFTAHPHMQVMPFYVFAESYGGKMTVDFALEFDKAIKNGDVVSDFRGVALGDSWISPMDSVNTWGTFLYQMGFVTRKGLQNIDKAAAAAQAEVDAGNWNEATNKWSAAELVVMLNANNVNFYNVLATEDIYRSKKSSNRTDLSFMSPALRRLYENHVARQTRDLLGDFMNGPQKEHWGIPDNVVWDSQGGYVFSYLSGDFMKPVISSVEKLLTETELEVVVFTGDLDLICDTPGTYRWIENMEWPGKADFMDASNEPIHITAYSSPAATIQAAGKFSLYTILRSGHMVPIDAPEMSLRMLDMIFGASKIPKTKQEAPKEKTVKHGEEPKEVPMAKLVKAGKTEENHKQEPVKQKTPTLKKLKEEALKEEAKKEQEAAKQKENKQEKAPKQEEAPKQEKAPKQKENKQEKAPKQEEAPKQEKAPKQKESKQEKAPKQEKHQKKVARPSQKKEHEQESRKQEVKKSINKAKAKVIAARQHQQQQRSRRNPQNPGPLPQVRRRR